MVTLNRSVTTVFNEVIFNIQGKISGHLYDWYLQWIQEKITEVYVGIVVYLH